MEELAHSVLVQLLLAGFWSKVFAAFFAVYVFVHTFEAKTRRAQVLLVVASLTILVSVVAVWHMSRSEYGRWFVLSPESKTDDYVQFLKDFPHSTHVPDAARAVRARRIAALASAPTPLARSIVEALIADPQVPAKIELQVVGHRKYPGPNGTMSAQSAERYNATLDRIPETIVNLLSTFTLPLGAEAHIGPASPNLRRTIFALEYLAVPGSTYVQQPSGYTFVAVDISSNHYLFRSGIDQPPVHVGVVSRFYPPSQPRWEGSKLPEQVVGDLVVEAFVQNLFAALNGANHVPK
jgi:hypothetical protein